MKNLEEEYKKSRQEETPDLWNRIETHLSEKKKKRIYRVRYLGFAAAALFCAVLIPGFWYLQNNDGRSGLEQAQMNDAETAEGSSAQDSNVQDSNAGESNAINSGLPESALAEESPKEDLQTDLAAGEALAEETHSGTDSQAEGNMQEMPLGMQEETAEGIRQIHVKVAAVTETEGQEVYILLTEDEEEIRAVCSEELLEPVLEEGGSYLLTLRKEKEKDWDYRIEKAEKAE